MRPSFCRQAALDHLTALEAAEQIKTRDTDYAVPGLEWVAPRYEPGPTTTDGSHPFLNPEAAKITNYFTLYPLPFTLRISFPGQLLDWSIVLPSASFG
jgi:hypothetical protein